MEKTISPEISRTVFQAVPLLIDFPTQRFWVDYDREADVLYISFQRPQKATDTEMTEEGILLRYRSKQLVGVTVLDASTRTMPEDVRVKVKAA
jgi:uncharacterized protein YuzE